MGYVHKNLMKDESVLYQAKIHWLVFGPTIFLFLLMLGFFILGESGSGTWVFGVLIFPFALAALVQALIARASTELAVTNKRVIAKFGFIKRNTIELYHNKVESFSVEQSILGRILGAGTIIINGTGSGKTPIPNIDNPMVFRRNAMEAVEAVTGV